MQAGCQRAPLLTSFALFFPTLLIFKGPTTPERKCPKTKPVVPLEAGTSSVSVDSLVKPQK